MLQRVSDGFVVMDGERLIGSAFTCPQGDYATIGLVIVSNDYQGQGIGRRLMEKAIAACDTRTPVLNATLAGAPLYASQGFVEFGRVQQHQGQAVVPALPTLADGETCRALNADDHASLLALAKAASGMDRREVLRDLQVEHAVGIERDGRLRGFALLRPFGRGRCIGPGGGGKYRAGQVPDRHLAGPGAGHLVRIDIPVACGLSDWLEQAGLKNIDTVAQMALGTPPQASHGVHPFALITQAIG